MQINQKIKKVAIIMGSQSDYLVMKKCEEISAHRTPDRMFAFAKTAFKNNFVVIVAGAGGSAHLPGMIASISTLPVLGVPIESKKLKGLDSLLSIVQMPKGIPVGTVAIGENGAFNAGLLAASIMALSDSKVKKNLEKWRRLQTAAIKKKPK
jgi:5-(carboxyamino)imidazole ribonucleotide mutase